MRSRSIFAPFITLLVISASALSQAAGSLDQSFGMGGTEVILAPVIGGTVQRDAVIQSDGKIVSLVSDQFSGATLIRIEPGGILDASFAGDGILETNWQLGPTLPKGLPQAMAIDGLGRLVVGGWWWVPQGSKKYVEMLRIDRYMPDGSRDLTFGTNGTVLFNRPYAVAIAVQSDGKIVVVGNSSVMRFHDNGNPDTSFGNSGTASSGLSNVYSLKLLSDGKILAAGDHTSGSDSSMCVTRINANGSLDQGFGTAGRASANFFGRGSYARANRVDLDPFGNIIAGGFARRKNSVEQDVAAARFLPNGQPDSSFNGVGRVTQPFTGQSANAWSIVAQGDGKIVLTGSAKNPMNANGFDVTLVRFNYLGMLDTSFGIGGIVRTDIDPGRSDTARSSFVWNDPDCMCEKIVIAGNSTAGASFARYLTF